MNRPHPPHKAGGRLRQKWPLSRRWTIRIILMLLAAVGVGLLLIFRGPNWSEVGQAFTNVNWWWVAAAVTLNIISVLIRTLSWWTILGEALTGYRVRYWTALSAYAVGLMANALLPGWIGEFARVAVLHRKLENRQGLWPTLFGTVIAHRLFDLVAAIGIAIWVIFVAPLPSWAFSSIIAVISLGVVLFVVGIAIALRDTGRSEIEKLGPLWRAIAYVRQGLSALRSARVSALAATFQGLGWLCQLMAVWTVMFAFQLDLPISAAGLVLVLVNIVTILPLWTGNVGVVQATIAIPLIDYGVSYSLGFAYGIGLDVIETSVGIAYGIGFFAEEGISFAAFRQARKEVVRGPLPGPDR